jgi:hypothetical protein
MTQADAGQKNWKKATWPLAVVAPSFFGAPRRSATIKVMNLLLVGLPVLPPHAYLSRSISAWPRFFQAGPTTGRMMKLSRCWRCPGCPAPSLVNERSFKTQPESPVYYVAAMIL